VSIGKIPRTFRNNFLYLLGLERHKGTGAHLETRKLWRRYFNKYVRQWEAMGEKIQIYVFVRGKLEE
jgi:hypothetical protein